MSKKKGVSTMSLKDFHGGSIPSDLPLPSAPGLIMPRTSSNRNASTANLMRTDLRPRPKSSGASRGFDDRASFLSHPASIGRNFDEDERKPLDAGASLPRRKFADESIFNLGAHREELNPEYFSSSVRVSDRPLSSPVPQSPSPGSGSLSSLRYGGRVTSVHSSQVNDSLKASSGMNSEDIDNGPPNAWGVRKGVMGKGEVGGSSGVSVVSKFAQASALEKVSSGMWQSKNPSHLSPRGTQLKDNSVSQSLLVGGERVDYADFHGSTVESGRASNIGHHHGAKELWSHGDEPDTKFGNVMSLPSTASAEVSERPKLKLLPRSKPLDTSESDHRWEYQQAAESGKIQTARELPQSANASQHELTDIRTRGQTAEKQTERPKLNLKPRSQPLEQHDGSLDKERNTLFGDGRPRELILKERGMDEAAINNIDLTQPHSHDRMSSPKNVGVPEQSVSTSQYSKRTDNRTPSLNSRIARDSERKDHRMDHEKANADRKNWRNDKWRNGRDTRDQQPEPETWRKPTEEPKPDSLGNHHGKLVSAFDLAQAFSKSVSNPKSLDSHSAQRSLPGHDTQVPFSRLTANCELYSRSTANHRMNGY